MQTGLGYYGEMEGGRELNCFRTRCAYVGNWNKVRNCAARYYGVRLTINALWWTKRSRKIRMWREEKWQNKDREKERERKKREEKNSNERVRFNYRAGKKSIFILYKIEYGPSRYTVDFIYRQRPSLRGFSENLEHSQRRSLTLSLCLQRGKNGVIFRRAPAIANFSISLFSAKN